jgi:hypothetical protein
MVLINPIKLIKSPAENQSYRNKLFLRSESESPNSYHVVEVSSSIGHKRLIYTHIHYLRLNKRDT